MTDLFEVLVYVSAAFGIAAFVLVIASLLLAPWIIDFADYYFSSLKLGKEPLFKGYPLSTGRMAHYGMVMMFRHTCLIKRWVLAGRDDRLQVIEASPRLMRHIMMWVYGGAMLCTFMFFLIGGAVVLIDKHWQVMN